jgi:hypothetical protein
MQSFATMTTMRKLSTVQLIFGDGIFDGERILALLGISNTCHLVLDQHHLTAEDWPKYFGTSQYQITLKQPFFDFLHNSQNRGRGRSYFPDFGGTCER